MYIFDLLIFGNRSFEGKNLRGKDFSHKNIKGFSFKSANLSEANFKHAKAGIPSFCLLFIIIFISFSSLFSGLIIGFSTSLPSVIFSQIDSSIYKEISALTFFNSFLFILLIYLYVLRGLNKYILYLSMAVFLSASFIAYLFKSNIGVDALIQLFVIAITFSSIILGTIVQTIFLTVLNKKIAIILFNFFGIIGLLSGINEGSGNMHYSISLLLTLILSYVLIVISTYISLKSIGGTIKYKLFKEISINFCSLFGTSFYGSILSNADFTDSFLPNCDFRKSTIKKTCWFNTKKLSIARIEDTYLENNKIRSLVTTKCGSGINYDYLEMRDLHLDNAYLVNSSFIGSDLSNSTLINCDLSRSKLVKTRLYDVDFNQANLTGCCIQDWSVSIHTNFNNVSCDYIFMRLQTKDNPDPWRKPDSWKENFGDGDFTDFITPIVKALNFYQMEDADSTDSKNLLKTIDLIHHNNIDPSAITVALKEISEKYPHAQLELVSLEGIKENKIRIKATIDNYIDQSEISEEYFKIYKKIIGMPDNNIQTLISKLEERDKHIKRLEDMVNFAIFSNRFYFETNYNMGDAMTKNNSVNIKAGGDVVNSTEMISGLVNLGKVTGDVSQTIQQLPQDSENLMAIKENLLRLQELVVSTKIISEEDKIEALEQLKVIASSDKNKTKDHKKLNTALKILKGTTTGISETNKFVSQFLKLVSNLTSLLL